MILWMSHFFTCFIYVRTHQKKVWELKNLYQILKEQFETYGNNIKPVKSAGTRSIDHRIWVMEKLVSKFVLYTQHIQNIIADTTKQLDCAKLQGKFNKSIESKVILQAAFLLDILAEAKILSLCTQEILISLTLLMQLKPLNTTIIS